MTDLPLPSPSQRATVNEEDVLAALAGIAPGWYRTSDLHPRHEELAERAGLVPSTRQAFGSAISRMGLESRWVHGHYRVWHVTEELAGHRA